MRKTTRLKTIYYLLFPCLSCRGRKGCENARSRSRRTRTTSTRSVRVEGFREREVRRYVKPSDKQTEAAQEACCKRGARVSRRQLNGMFAAAEVAAELFGESVQTLG